MGWESQPAGGGGGGEGVLPVSRVLAVCRAFMLKPFVWITVQQPHQQVESLF